MSRWVLRLAIFGFLLALVCLSVPYYMRFSMGPYIATSIESVATSSIALVPGASVIKHEPSPILAKRADAAIALFKAQKVSRIFITGDARETYYDEVTPVKAYLIAAGIPETTIILDGAGYDTYTSMYRARQLFKDAPIVIVTQAYHLPRALWIARHLGLNASGYVAAGDTGINYDSLREIPASVKACIDILFKRTPEYFAPAMATSMTPRMP